MSNHSQHDAGKKTQEVAGATPCMTKTNLNAGRMILHTTPNKTDKYNCWHKPPQYRHLWMRL